MIDKIILLLLEMYSFHASFYNTIIVRMYLFHARFYHSIILSQNIWDFYILKITLYGIADLESPPLLWFIYKYIYVYICVFDIYIIRIIITILFNNRLCGLTKKKKKIIVRIYDCLKSLLSHYISLNFIFVYSQGRGNS